MKLWQLLSNSTGRFVRIPLIATVCLLPAVCAAAEVIVRVSGLSEPLGQVDCALFAGPKGFPMDNSAARKQSRAADAEGVTCRYTDVAEGSYAVSIGHDRNGNKRVDTNFLGMPKEQWGVSNNVRPSLRAPRFEEAMFKVLATDQEVVIEIRADK